MAEVRTTSSTGGSKGVKLARFDLIPVGPLTELAEHYGRGALKYANHQWRQGYEWSKSYAALWRHLTDFWAGKDYDVCSNDPGGCSFVTAEGEEFTPAAPDTCYNHTGSHHMAAVAWHAFCLLEFKDVHPDHDDRYESAEEEERRLLAEQARLDAVDYARRVDKLREAVRSGLPEPDEDLADGSWSEAEEAALALGPNTMWVVPEEPDGGPDEDLAKVIWRNPALPNLSEVQDAVNYDLARFAHLTRLGLRGAIDGLQQRARFVVKSDGGVEDAGAAATEAGDLAQWINDAHNGSRTRG